MKAIVRHIGWCLPLLAAGVWPAGGALPSPSPAPDAGARAVDAEIAETLDHYREKVTVSAGPETVLSAPDRQLEGYLDLALEKNLDLRIAAGTMRSDEAQLRAALAGLFPQLDFNALYERLKTNGDYSDLYTAQVMVTQPVWDGQLWGAYRQQKAQAAASGFARDRVRQQIELEVSQLYFDLLRLDQTVAENAAQIARLEEQVHIADEMLSSGSMTKADVLRSRNSLSDARKTLLESLVSARNQAIKLNQTLRQPPDLSVSAVRPGRIELFTPDREVCLRLASAHRPDIKEEEFLVRVAEAGVTLARQNFFPTLTVNGWYGADEAEKLESSELSWGLQAALTFPLFHSTQNWSLLASAKELLGNAEANLAKVEEQAAAGITATLVKLASSISEIHLLLQYVASAQNQLDIDKELYKEGRVKTSDLLQSYANSSTVRIELIDAIYMYLILTSQLRQEVGGVRVPRPGAAGAWEELDCAPIFRTEDAKPADGP